MADLFGAVTDDAINRIINFAHARAPYLFNYVAPSLAFVTDDQGKVTGTKDLWLTCSPVPDPPPGVPKYRRIPAFELPGIPIKLPYSIQLIDLTLDFHPSDTLNLPAELNPPLAAQRFAISAMVQFGFACMPPALVENLIKQQFGTFILEQHGLPVLPVEALDCFLLSLFATGHLTVKKAAQPVMATSALDEIRLEIDGIEIVDIAPKGLEHVIECYLVAMLKGYVLPNAVLALQRLVVNTLGITTVTPTLTAGLPNNPAIEENELRVWLDLTV
jgi:hypothetical protein